MNDQQRALLDAGLSYLTAGLSIIPIDGATKRPYWRLLPQACAWPREKDEDGLPSNRVKGIWQTFVHVRATEKELRVWIDAGAQLALVGGAISGGLLIIDVDEPRFYDAWRESVDALADDLPLQRTGGGGYQILMRCADDAFWYGPDGRERGNEKLAWVPDETKRDGRAIAIETRAARGYAVIAPSLHPSGNRYQMLSGDVTAIPVIGRAHAAALLDAAIALDEAPFTRDQLAKAAAATVKTDRYRAQMNGQGSVIDLFNERVEIVDELRRVGYVRRGSRLHLPGNGDPLRPGVVLLDEERTSFHHDSEDPLSDGHTHTAFDVFCHFDHQGDCKEAVKAAAERLGIQRERPEPTFDADGFACCPGCGKRLRQATNGNGWRCLHGDELGFWWQGEGYTPPPAEQKAEPANRQVDTATGEISDGAPAPDDFRRVIEVLDMDIPLIADEAWAAIQELWGRETDPPLLRRGADICRLERAEKGIVLATVEKRRMRGALSRACIFQETRTGKNGSFIRIVAPPAPVVDDMLVNIDQRLPAINRVVRVPCLAPDGSLMTTGGYHANARAYYDPLPGITIPPVDTTPSRADMERARSLILDDLLVDFPFVEQADRAHAVALLLLPYVRELVNGPTPLHFVEAPTMGSGKGLLIDVLLTVGMGVIPQAMSAPTEDAEWGKKITAALMGGPASIFIDNVNHTLDSGALAAALTATEYTDRILGASEMVRTPVRCVWVASGNNPTFSTEIARRCIRIRIDPKIDKPQLRTGFKHEYLKEWAAEHHGELIWAAITLARYGMAHAGKRRYTLGSYEGWATLMGRILDGIEVSGFLGNLAALYDRADVETAAWRALVEAWWDEYGEKEVQAADLFALAEKNDIDFALRGKTERALRTAFGMALARMEDRVLTLQDPNPTAGSRMIRIGTTGVSHKVKLWKLTDTTANLADTRERLEEKGVPGVPGVPSSTPLTHIDMHAHAQEIFRSTEGTPGTPGTPKRERVDIDEVLRDVPATRRDRLVSLLRSINPSQQADARGICDRYHIDYEAARQAVQED